VPPASSQLSAPTAYAAPKPQDDWQSASVPSNDEHTILCEALIVADHNAYHVGELGILRQVEDAWGPRYRG
jgi:hypothetical protein